MPHHPQVEGSVQDAGFNAADAGGAVLAEGADERDSAQLELCSPNRRHLRRSCLELLPDHACSLLSDPWVQVSSYERIFSLHEQPVEKVYDEAQDLSRLLALCFWLISSPEAWQSQTDVQSLPNRKMEITAAANSMFHLQLSQFKWSGVPPIGS